MKTNMPPDDKIIHSLGGCIIALVTFISWHWVYSFGCEVSYAVAWQNAFQIAVIKELADKWGGYGGDCDIMDWAATMIGAQLGLCFCLWAAL